MSKEKKYKWQVVSGGNKFLVEPYKPSVFGSIPWQGEMLGIGIGEFMFLFSTRELARVAATRLNHELACTRYFMMNEQFKKMSKIKGWR